MFKLRDYQEENGLKGFTILNEFKIVYLAMQVRTGKTVTSLQVCKLYGAKKVLFLTKKKAIESIEKDYINFGFDKSFVLVVGNNESLHKIEDNDFDVVINDENHRHGSYPKPGKMAKDFKARFSKLPMIFLSGTPTPESKSQWYHQFWVSENSPFKEYSNFYKWAKEFVNVKIKYISYGQCKDYSDANNKLIGEYINHLLVTYTQSQAGFESKITEHVLECPMKPSTYALIKRLRRDLVVEGKGEVILADTGVKLMQKVHQIASGTIKFESGNRMVLDDSKALFIKQYFAGKKIGIFYKFVAEYEALKSVFGDDLTNNLEEFNSTGKHIALQIVSGREGISLKNADYLVYYNIDFSATSYWQSRDRLTTMERKSNDIYWVFSSGGIEAKIYEQVMNKRDYTLSVYKKDFKYA